MYFLLVILSLVVSTDAVNCLERIVAELTQYMASGTLNLTN